MTYRSQKNPFCYFGYHWYSPILKAYGGTVSRCRLCRRILFYGVRIRGSEIPCTIIFNSKDNTIELKKFDGKIALAIVNSHGEYHPFTPPL